MQIVKPRMENRKSTLIVYRTGASKVYHYESAHVKKLNAQKSIYKIHTYVTYVITTEKKNVMTTPIDAAYLLILILKPFDSSTQIIHSPPFHFGTLETLFASIRCLALLNIQYHTGK